LERRQQQVPLLPLLAATDRDMCIANLSSLAADPRGERRTKQCIDGGTLIISWAGVPHV
jgi:hypothetical protein